MLGCCMKTLDVCAVSAFFLATGILHFVRPALFLKIMPTWVPAPAFVNLGVGAAEGALACLWLVPHTHATAGWCLIALLVAVFPANIAMATGRDASLGIPSAWLVARLPLQGLLIYWVWVQIAH